MQCLPDCVRTHNTYPAMKTVHGEVSATYAFGELCVSTVTTSEADGDTTMFVLKCGKRQYSVNLPWGCRIEDHEMAQSLHRLAPQKSMASLIADVADFIVQIVRKHPRDCQTYTRWYLREKSGHQPDYAASVTLLACRVIAESCFQLPDTQFDVAEFQ